MPPAICGDERTSTTAAKRGWLYQCRAMMGGGGAFRDGPWIDAGAGTYDLTAKPTVDGRVSWPEASVRVRRLSGGRVRITGNGLPVGSVTGTFPVASDDDAYEYDRNPNSIAAQRVSITLPRARRASSPSCVDGMVGYAVNGVAIFNAVDGENATPSRTSCRIAVAATQSGRAPTTSTRSRRACGGAPAAPAASWAGRSMATRSSTRRA